MRGRAFAIAAGVAVLVGGIGVVEAQNRGLPGWATYVEKCAVCHGDGGNGDGPAAKTMLPRPRVFKKTNYKFRTTASGALPMREDLLRVITEGVPGTAMPDFAHLPEATRLALVDVIESFSEDFQDEDLQSDRESLPLPERPDTDLEIGYQVYLQNKCWECHGPSGLGNGPTWADKKDDDQNPIVPADLSRWHQLRCGDSIECLFRATQTGLNGTPMPSTPMKDEDRWQLSAWLKSIQQPKKETLDRVVVAKRLEELPKTVEDEAWEEVPQQMFYLVGQVVQKPRLFWPAVTEVLVRAAYNDEEVVLLVEWHDRDQSKGKNLTEFKPEEDPVTAIFVPFGNPPHTDHPDQLAVQFPSGVFTGEERPYFLFGDGGKEVNLWWWGSHMTGGVTNPSLGGAIERNATGSKNLVDQAVETQQLKAQAAYPTTKISVDGKAQDLPIGRYKVQFRRALTTDDEHDVQFEVGKFVPIAFNVWQGSQGEIGLRRAVSTWYLMVLAPPVPTSAYAAPVVAGGLVLVLLVLVVVRVRRSPAPVPEVEEVREPVPAPVVTTLVPEIEPAGRVSVTGVVTVVLGTAIAVYLIVIGLSALLTHLGEKEKVQVTKGKDEAVKELKTEQQGELSGYEWVDPKAKTVKVPIERAMELVVEDAAQGKGSKLVPAVGAQDKPTQPPVPGKQEPPKPGTVPASGAQPAGGAPAPAGAAPAGAAPAGAAPAGAAPAGAAPAGAAPAGAAPAGAAPAGAAPAGAAPAGAAPAGAAPAGAAPAGAAPVGGAQAPAQPAGGAQAQPPARPAEPAKPPAP
jgi:DMSO reductase family type II enzyme heme b subunit